MIQARPLWLAHFHLKIFITSFSLHASYIPIMPNSSLYLEHILVSFHFWGLCEEYVLCPELPSALHIKINVLKDSSSVSFTVESYLPLFHCPTLIHCSSVLLQNSIHLSTIAFITLFNMLVSNLVFQNRDLVIFEFLVQYLTCSLKHSFSVNVF